MRHRFRIAIYLKMELIRSSDPNYDVLYVLRRVTSSKEEWVQTVHTTYSQSMGSMIIRMRHAKNVN